MSTSSPVATLGIWLLPVFVHSRQTSYNSNFRVVIRYCFFFSFAFPFKPPGAVSVGRLHDPLNGLPLGCRRF